MARLDGEIADALRAFASRTAIVSHSDQPPRSMTYAELAEHIGHWRGRLVRAGLRPGHILPLFTRRTPEAIALAFAVVLEGGACSWLHPKSQIPQLRRAVVECDAIGLVVDDAAAAVLRDATADDLAIVRPLSLSDPDDWSREHRAVSERAHGAAWVLYTSGTTGAPKGVRIAGDDLAARGRTEIDCFGLTPDDAVLCLLPFSFDVGINQLWSSLLAGATLHIADAWLRADVADVIGRARITGLSAVPSLWSIALKGLAPGELLFGEGSTLRYVTVSGGSLAPTAFEALSTGLGTRVDIHKTYGQSETFRSAIFVGAQRAEHRARLGSVGRAVPGVTLFTARDAETVAAPGEEGEVMHGGCGTMLGYLGDDALTREKLGRHAAATTPVIYTGDRGVLDEDGYLTLRGRSDMMIKSNGYRVYPKEVEDALAEHPGIVESAVFGVPDALAGERVIAVVTAQPSIDPHAVRAFAAQRLPDYMVPRQIAIWPQLPRTASGKPALSEIRERFLSRSK